MTANPLDPAWFAVPPASGAPPPVEHWQPPFCGDSQMHIARDGTWFHQGQAIRRPELVRLFCGLLRKDDEGFMLVTPAEKLSIRVEDAPFIAVALEDEADALVFITNAGDRATPDQGWRLVIDDRGTAIPYVTVRRGLEARVSRNVYYQLAERLVEQDGAAGVISAGHFYAMGSP